tara:strand:+ start:1161 stop:1376 length:216 start_codon:yes stop_codon:yes gene_type:complete
MQTVYKWNQDSHTWTQHNFKYSISITALELKGCIFRTSEEFAHYGDSAPDLWQVWEAFILCSQKFLTPEAQ